MNNCNIIINTDDETERQILEMYWKMKDGFVKEYDSSIVSEKFNKSPMFIGKLANEKSNVTIICSKCPNILSPKKNNWTELNLLIERQFFLCTETILCDVCKKPYIEKIMDPKELSEYKPNEDNRRKDKMQVALANKVWRNLPSQYFGILITIIKCEGNKQKVLDSLFNKNEMGSYEFKTPYGKEIWNIINNHLEKNNDLIWTKRNDNQIVEFYFEKELKAYLIEEFPIMFQDEISPNTLSIGLIKQGENYKGKFVLTQDVKFSRGSVLVYNGKINSDGSIKLIISPNE